MSKFSQSKFAANLQQLVSQRREEAGLYKEIAESIQLPDSGRLLDVGTGSGLQLKVIHQINPEIELYGVDLSTAAIDIAKANLAGLPVDLRVESTEETSFADDFFDIVTCNSSMSYWENLVVCYDEIYRILAPGGSTRFFEPQKEIDLDEVVAIIKQNLADVSPIRRFLAASLNYVGLRWGRKIGLKLYAVEELEAHARQSKFGDSFSIERVTLQNLPIFARIQLTKPT